MTMYRQVQLIHSITGTEHFVRYVSWIPSEFAIVDKIIRVKIGGDWQDGWKVEWVGAEEITEEQSELLASMSHMAHANIR